MQALGGGQISLAEAVITEFEDAPKAVQQLMAAADTARFGHTVAQVRAERATAQALAAAEASCLEQGYTLLDDEAQRGWKLDCVPLRRLVTVDDSGNDVGADEDAITEPKHWGFGLDEYEEFIDTTTGDVVDEDEIDWNTEDFPNETPAEGFRHRNSVTERTAFARAGTA
jgi:ParB family chromosome partitioning protein